MTDILIDPFEPGQKAEIADDVAPDQPRPTTLAQALEQARDKLLDRSLRNKLIHTNLANARARQVRVFDELSDEVFALLRENRAMTFAPVQKRETAEDLNEPSAEEGGLTVWAPPENDDADERGVAARHRDTRLQTRMTPEGLQKRLLSLYRESQAIEEEQGVNVLYLALGFLKWREAKQSEEDRFAPLVLLPVELTRDGARDRFTLRLRPDDLYANVSLQASLREQFGVELPDLPEDEWSPGAYFDAVQAAIGGRAGWSVQRDEILLGFFSFAKFLLWRDLDPKNWPKPEMLTGHPLLGRILLRDKHEARAFVDTPIIDEHERIDEVFPPAKLLHVTDADSSQAIAIQEALSGKDLVIQGPPGTGKSQTITNIIAAAVHAGKRVLFVAEKMAALEVVHERLEKQKLSPICLELHSRKASKVQVLEQIRKGQGAPVPPKWSDQAIADVDAGQKLLRAHSDGAHDATAYPFSAYELIGKISLLKQKGTPAPTFDIPAAASWSKAALEEVRQRAALLDQRLVSAGVPADHPWRGIGIDTPNVLQQERLQPLITDLVTATSALDDSATEAAGLLCKDAAPALGTLDGWIGALRHLAVKPEGVDALVSEGGLDPGDKVLRGLIEAGGGLQRASANVGQQVRQEAWSMDWTRQRQMLARHGGSWLRFLASDYRAAVADLRGIWNGPLPKSRDVRLKVVEGLIDAAAARLVLTNGAEHGRAALGGFWRGEETDWTQLGAALDWISVAERFQPALNLRHAAVVPRSAEAAACAETLTRTLAAATQAFDATVGALRPDVAVALDDRRLDELLPRDLCAVSARWKGRFADIVQWPLIRDDLAWLEQLAGATLERQVYCGAVPAGGVEPILLLAAAEAQWEALVKVSPDLRKFDGDQLNDIVARYRKADTRRISIASDQVARAHIDAHPTGSAGAVGILRDEMRKAKKLKPVRKLMKEAGEAVQRFKPVFMMSPLSVAQFLEPGILSFDMLVIDEASQVRPEDALGAIARCKQLVVVGDSKQLPPTSFFSRMVNDEPDPPEDEDEDNTHRVAAVRDIESILNLCSQFPERMLKWHYRSEHPALIATSNRCFYGNELQLPPSVLVNVGDGDTGLVFHKVQEGGYDRGRTARNEIEAEEIAQAVLRHADQHPDLSLGIGAFSVAQRDCIRDRIDNLARKHPQLDDFLKGTDKRAPLFVKNLENIQGDERDVIFISVGYGRDRDGRLTQNFGPVGREGGERRLNVLITRARKRCEVFSSIVAEDIKLETGAGKPGVLALKEFLKLAKDGYSDFAWATERDFDSEFEEAVAYAIRGLGYQCRPQVGMAGFFIDLAVLDPKNPDRYLLGIECDGAAYHSSRYARDRDRLRQEILEKRGWKIHRIWSTDWFHRQEREVAKLKAAVETALQGGALPTAGHAYDPEPTYDVSDEPHLDDGVEEAPDVGFSPTPARVTLSPYEFANFHDANFSSTPHLHHDSTLARLVSKIVEIEQPIHEDEVARRLAGLCGLQRAGNRIQDAALRGLRWARRDGALKNDRQFWRLAGDPEPIARDRSDVVGSENVRKPEYIAPSEVGHAARFALEQCIALSREDLVVETARLLGFARTGKDVSALIELAIDSDHFLADVELDHAGRLRLAQPR